MAESSQSWRSWTVPLSAFVLGGGLMTVLAWVVKVPAPPPLESLGEYVAPGLVIAREDRLPAGAEARERLWLLSPAPLFLPSSETSVQSEAQVGTAEGGGEVVREFPAVLVFPGSRPTRDILRAPALGSSAEMAERLARPRWFDGAARTGDALSSGASEVRVARVEIYRTGAPEPVAALEVSDARGLPPVVWKPLELSALVDVAGLVGMPVLIESSGVDEIDERIRWIVGREVLPTLRLQPGIYRLEVGP